MKQIKGQTLLSINQYFPTDYLRMAKKSQGMMNLFIDNISEKVRKGIMDCDLESSSLEISNQASPLFTLTAEEVEIVRFAIYDSLRFNKQDLGENGWAMGKTLLDSVREEIKQKNQILTRIKEWKDEHNK